MMTDMELLELAARAEGLNFHHIDAAGVWCSNGPMDARVKKWNPLTDDGNALRLATKLRLRISISDNHEYTEVVYYREFGLKRDHGGVVEQWGSDRDAATRRAIVRAAAEIGKAMMP